jgi:hypothetical protein
MNTRIKGISIAILLGTAFLVSGTANAKSAFDGSSNLICAAFDVMACVDGTICSRGEARAFDLPEFMSVDFKEKNIQVTYEAGNKTAVSPIKLLEVTGNQLVLHGLENNHGWVMAIHQETGRMSVAAVGHEVSFTMTGACKAP